MLYSNACMKRFMASTTCENAWCKLGLTLTMTLLTLRLTSGMTVSRSCVCAGGGHFEHMLWQECLFIRFLRTSLWNCQCNLKNLCSRAFRGFRAQRFYLKKSKFFRKRVGFVFCKFYFLILPTRSGSCILIFTPLESSLKVLSNCVFLKLLI